MYLGNIHNMSFVPVTFGNFFFKSSKYGTFWAKLRRVNMACTILLNSALFFGFKNWCKITSQNKNSLTSALSIAGLQVKKPFFSKNAFFRQKKTFFQKIHFIQKCSVIQNTVLQYVKNNFLLSQKKFVFFTILNLTMLHIIYLHKTLFQFYKIQ